MASGYMKDIKGNRIEIVDASARSQISQKYTKPIGGIPATDLANGVIPSDSHINSLIEAKLATLINVDGEEF